VDILADGIEIGQLHGGFVGILRPSKGLNLGLLRKRRASQRQAAEKDNGNDQVFHFRAPQLTSIGIIGVHQTTNHVTNQPQPIPLGLWIFSFPFALLVCAFCIRRAHNLGSLYRDYLKKSVE
jgi:hypothetical protein